MQLRQFEYKPLAHYSYAIISKGEMAIVDPERDPLQYYAFAEANKARIVAVFETHPHADFVSSHLQIHQETGATIYASELIGADYPHKTFDEGDELKIGDLTFSALNTPGHSPDSITIVVDGGDQMVLFTGDTLFVGDVGRPDLRENAGHMKAKREDLASKMYATITSKFKNLPDDALIYPAHGAGSLCGKGMGDASSSTLGNERMGNWAFKEQSEEEFINRLLEDQPFIPHYFGYNVAINKKGAPILASSIASIPIHLGVKALPKGNISIIDTRDEEEFKRNHFKNSFNIMAVEDSQSFETWLGSIIEPEEPFYLIANKINHISTLKDRIAKIGYENQCKGILTLGTIGLNDSKLLDVSEFEQNQAMYTIVDVRNKSEVEDGKYFDQALSIPLDELRERTDEIPTDKPVVVHCAGGYRSAAGSSILDTALTDATVYDLSEAVKKFQN